jgi:hypothetical protein
MEPPLCNTVHNLGGVNWKNAQDTEEFPVYFITVSYLFKRYHLTEKINGVFEKVFYWPYSHWRLWSSGLWVFRQIIKIWAFPFNVPYHK